MKYNPNVQNTELKGVRGNWEEPVAYKSQKHVLGKLKYFQGSGNQATGAAVNKLASQFDKKLNINAPKQAAAPIRRASISPNRNLGTMAKQ